MPALSLTPRATWTQLAMLQVAAVRAWILQPWWLSTLGLGAVILRGSEGSRFS